MSGQPLILQPVRLAEVFYERRRKRSQSPSPGRERREKEHYSFISPSINIQAISQDKARALGLHTSLPVRGRNESQDT